MSMPGNALWFIFVITDEDDYAFETKIRGFDSAVDYAECYVQEQLAHPYRADPQEVRMYCPETGEVANAKVRDIIPVKPLLQWE